MWTRVSLKEGDCVNKYEKVSKNEKLAKKGNIWNFLQPLQLSNTPNPLQDTKRWAYFSISPPDSCSVFFPTPSASALDYKAFATNLYPDTCAQVDNCAGNFAAIGLKFRRTSWNNETNLCGIDKDTWLMSIGRSFSVLKVCPLFQLVSRYHHYPTPIKLKCQLSLKWKQNNLSLHKVFSKTSWECHTYACAFDAICNIF